MSFLFKSKKSKKEAEIEVVDQDIQPDQEEVVEQDEKSNNSKEKSPGSIGSILKSILSSVRVGSDVLSSGISLPAWIYEPLSIVQRQAEMLEYSSLLDRAAECKDRIDRMAYVVAFAVSGYSGTQRYHNAFNPIIGETFEFVDEDRGFDYLAEQVSHHPPISAVHAESKKWTFYQNSNPKTSWMGNSLELDTHGRTHIYFPKSKDHFYYTNPKTRIHNLILGKMWMEHHGHLEVTNLKNGDTANVKFKKCNFFSNTCVKKIEGEIKNEKGDVIVQINGDWDQFVEATWLEDTRDSEKDKKEELWRLTEDNFIEDKYRFTKFAASLNNTDERLEQIIPPTDSRLRPDRRKVETSEWDVANKMKKMLEERQRSDKKKRSSDGEDWTPQWFHKIPDEDGKGHTWVYCGNYWEQRKEKIEKILEGEDMNECDLLDGGNAKNTASDFRSYDFDN